MSSPSDSILVDARSLRLILEHFFGAEVFAVLPYYFHLENYPEPEYSATLIVHSDDMDSYPRIERLVVGAMSALGVKANAQCVGSLNLSQFFAHYGPYDPDLCWKLDSEAWAMASNSEAYLDLALSSISDEYAEEKIPEDLNDEEA